MKTEKRYWTEEELALLKTKMSNAAAAERLKRSEASVRSKRTHVGIYSPDSGPSEYDEDVAKAASNHWRVQYKALLSKYQKALRERSATDQLVALASSMAPVRYSPAPPVCPRPKKDGTAQSALLLLSDTHIGQVVTKDQTLGFNEYNFNVFLARLKFLENSVTSIMEDHTTTPVDELVIALGGDMIHGALNHAAEAAQHSTIFEQLYGGAHALAQFLRNIARVVPKIRIVTTTGNHPRLPHQHKMPTDNRYSNFDTILAAYVEALTSEIKTIKWNIDKQPATVFDVKGFVFHLSHGDNVRGGDRALGIPNHAVGRQISSTTQLFGKHGLAAPNYYLLGHLHRSIVLPHARGSVIINGGFPGIDGFGLACGFSPVDPTQTFFFVHERFGKTASYDIQLKHAVVNRRKVPYIIPKTFTPE